MRAVSLLIIASFVLASCGAVRDSRINPFNWFGRAERVETDAAENTNALIPARSIFERRGGAQYNGRTVPQITELRVERVGTGALVTAAGLAQRTGAFDVRLILEDNSNGTLTYALQTLYHSETARGRTERSRLVTAGVRLTSRQLEGVQTIRVRGQGNALQSRR